MSSRCKHIAVALIFAGVLLGGCDRGEQPAAKVTIRLATTTSTENSGLLAVLLPVFTEQTGIGVHVLPMGTGRALQTGIDGNCDALLVHAPAAERKFVTDGWGVARRRVMYNEFLILGPASDPAGVKGMTSPTEAMRAIASAEARFVSRGDNSGTHKKELALWKAADLEPAGEWYYSVGKGMGHTLTMAGQIQAYTLCDSGTFLKFRDKISLAKLLSGDETLLNPYSVIAVNPVRHKHVQFEAATKFIEFLTGPDARRIIGQYTIAGELAFHPWPINSDEEPAK